MYVGLGVILNRLIEWRSSGSEEYVDETGAAKV